MMRPTVFVSSLFGLLALAAAQPAQADATLHQGFGIHAGMHLGLGQMGPPGSQNQHSEGLVNLEAMPGWRFSQLLMVGLLVDFRAQSQLDDASRTGGVDFSGRSVLFGVGATFEPGRAKFLLSYDPIDRQWISGNGSVYRGSGFHILAGYKFEPNWAAEVEFTQAGYDSLSYDGIKSGLGNADLTHWNVGLGVSCSY